MKWLLLILLGIPLLVAAQTAPPVTIDTQFDNVANQPFNPPYWLLIMRDASDGTVTPYMLPFDHNNNAWVNFAPGHDYQITVSQIIFNNHLRIDNFLHLQNRFFHGESLHVTLTGKLNPNRYNTHAQIQKIPFE